MTYNRQRNFESMEGTALGGDDLDVEFNAVQAELARIEELLGAGSSGGTIVVDAGDAQFAPLGTETNASRVAAAIQFALSSESRTRVVLVPTSMWRYCQDGDFSTAIFNESVFMVREGAIVPWFDPIAYGADLLGAADSRRSFQTAHDHAAVSDGPGARVVALTVPGQYTLGNPAVQQKDVAFIRFPGVVLNGTAMDGDVVWTIDGVTTIQQVDNQAARPATGTRVGHAVFIKDTKKLDVWDGDSWERVNPDASVVQVYTFDDALAAGSKVVATTVTREVIVKVKATSDSGGKFLLSLAETGFPAMAAANIVHIIASLEETGAGVSSVEVLVDTSLNRLELNLDGNAPGSKLFTANLRILLSS
jgi:hypothetical protein